MNLSVKIMLFAWCFALLGGCAQDGDGQSKFGDFLRELIVESESELQELDSARRKAVPLGGYSLDKSAETIAFLKENGVSPIIERSFHEFLLKNKFNIHAGKGYLENLLGHEYLSGTEPITLSYSGKFSVDFLFRNPEVTVWIVFHATSVGKSENDLNYWEEYPEIGISTVPSLF